MIIQDTSFDKSLARRGARPTRLKRLRTFLTSWELYPILLLAVFFHFYHIDTAIFKFDEPEVYRFAREAITHGFIPLTSNSSSLGTMNPPLFVYLGMIPAVFSGDPLWAQVLVGFCNMLAVVFTYIFVRRYYGRLAGGIAALLYTTAVVPFIFSRSFWPLDLLPFFTVLFLIVIFRGIYERRRGWFAPAVLLAAMAYQLHGTGIFLLVPLALATLFAWRTLRVRDLLWAGGGLLLLFAPFIYWEVKSNFFDVHILLHVLKGSAGVTEHQPLHWYLYFLSPYVQSISVQDPVLPIDPRSLLVSSPLHYFTPFLRAVQVAMPFLLLCGLLTAVGQVILPLRPRQQETAPRLLGGLFNWWAAFSASPYRQGLVLLLSWQIIPLALLYRESIPLYAHYFNIFVPGQFILIALFLSNLVKLVQSYRPRWSIWTRAGVGAVAASLILAYFLGCFTLLFDTAYGYFTETPYSNYFYSDVASLQKVIAAADKLAQERHIRRIYISSDYGLSQAMYYYAEQMHTPTSVFENDRGCYVLPSPDAGPVVFLTRSDSLFDDSFLAAYAQTTLVQTSPRPGGPPFKLYILTAKPTPASAAQSFTSGLQLLSSRAHRVTSSADNQNQQWLTTRWRVMNTAFPALRTTYHFTFQYQATGPWSGTPICSASSLWAGDQLFAYTSNSDGAPLPATLSVQATSSKDIPIEYRTWFNLWLVAHKTQESDKTTLYTTSGQSTLTLPVTASVE